MLSLCIGRAQVNDGFISCSWGTPFEKLKERFDLKPSPYAEGREQYRTNVELIGNARVSQCDFEFIDGRLSGVIITTPDLRNSRALLRYLMALFGNANMRDVPTYQWLSGDTHAAYDEDSEGGSCVYVYSLSIQKKRDGPPADARK
jgi:hypothetical protein